MKNSKDTIGNRTRDLPACSAVPSTNCVLPPPWWVQCDPQTKIQSPEWRDTNSPVSKKPRAQPSNTKIMLIALSFFERRGVVHKGFAPLSQTEHQDVYEGVSQLLAFDVVTRRCGQPVRFSSYTTVRCFISPSICQ